MASMVPPSFFLLCWVLQTTSSAFPEETGPLNFIPTEGIDLPTFFAFQPPAQLAQVVMCEVWGLALTFRVLNLQWEHTEEVTM